MLPAHQRFEAYRAPAAAVDDGLVVHAEQISFSARRRSCSSDRSSRARSSSAGLKRRLRLRPLALHCPDGQAGVTEQGIEVEAVLRVLADADAGCQAQLGVAQTNGGRSWSRIRSAVAGHAPRRPW